MRDEMQQQERDMVARFVEMRKHVAKAEEELNQLRSDTADFGYLATLRFPNFLDHVSESSKDPEDYSTSVFMLLTEMLCNRGLRCAIDRDRRKDETVRSWMQRCETAARKEMAAQEAARAARVAAKAKEIADSR